MTGKSRKKPFIKIILILLVLAVLGYAGYRFLQVKKASSEADAVMKVMYDLVPGLGTETDESMGGGSDPLLTLSINDVDIVGCLEIPSIDLMIPVTVKSEGKNGFASAAGGSPVKGKFIIEGDRETTFYKLSKCKPDDKVIFTDIEGIRYSYRVITQYTLKDWDKAGNDLMVCYRVDDQTRFVLGCTVGE